MHGHGRKNHRHRSSITLKRVINFEHLFVGFLHFPLSKGESPAFKIREFVVRATCLLLSCSFKLMFLMDVGRAFSILYGSVAM